jgi:hypothetical protein
MIREVEENQQAYCKLKEEYQEKYRRQDMLVRSYEHQVQLRTQTYDVYLKKIEELKEWEREFLGLKGGLIESIA